ncbi:efflux RND transporter periplasmic adaptor subunit [Hyphomicrobium sp.]|uniref:efflux RND transporter periplasmic adaptor subunit n=1 Tax=Hyphomicrobium sp. TaxID=82 RepID=UPI0025B88466|nr:efflux RND transporter periplasmic adaptor subunit [Hyphomicrobium sp.]MCC7252289.1 efflux RND transporter periplasmic adaptor subunit [Hyphomicrobium sp.]
MILSRILIAGVTGLAAAGAVYFAWTQSITSPVTAEATQRAAQSKEAAQPKAVRVVHPEPLRETGTITLTGRTAPAEQAIVASRASGVAAKRLVDIGDKVAAGDVLLVIDAPEVDQELARAKASVQQTRARLDLARVNAGRAEQLVKQGHVSEQQRDERTANERVAEADLAAAEAEVQRLAEVQGFLTVRAPFAGTVVARAVERGDRISATDSQPSAPLFRIARLDELRVELDVPQTDTLKVRLGNAAKVSFAELPGEVFEAKVVRRAGVIDQASSTMRAELMMTNPEERIPAGLTGVVTLGVVRERAPVTVPTNTLVTRDGRQQVAVVAGEDEVAFRAVMVGRDFGERVEIVAGLAPSDRVILSPNALLREGDKVAVTMATVSKATDRQTR